MSGRCAGFAVTAARPCRARTVYGTSWCLLHHPFDNPLEAIGGPWDGDEIAGPCILGGQAPLVRRVGAPGNAAWCRRPGPGVYDMLGVYELTCTRGRIADPKASRAALRASDRLWYEWMPASLGVVPDARHGEGTV